MSLVYLSGKKLYLHFVKINLEGKNEDAVSFKHGLASCGLHDRCSICDEVD